MRRTDGAAQAVAIALLGAARGVRLWIAEAGKNLQQFGIGRDLGNLGAGGGDHPAIGVQNVASQQARQPVSVFLGFDQIAQLVDRRRVGAFLAGAGHDERSTLLPQPPQDLKGRRIEQAGRR